MASGKQSLIIEKRYNMAFARTEIKELEPMVKSGKKRFVRYQEGAELYSMGLHTFEQLAKEAGAIYKIRRVVLVNLDILMSIWTPSVCEHFAPPAHRRRSYIKPCYLFL